MLLPKALSPAKLAANRRNALKSTGPRTGAGKRRAMLNAITRDLCPEELDRQLRARGEDPREFCRLHRDLVALFRPEERAEVLAVTVMARTWWDKARRTRDWVAAGPARTDDLDALLEELLLFLVHAMRKRQAHWGYRLGSVLGRPLGAPADVRRRIESRLFVFGAKPGRRKYPGQSRQQALLRKFMKAFSQRAAETAEGTAGPPDASVEAKRDGSEDDGQTVAAD